MEWYGRATRGDARSRIASAVHCPARGRARQRLAGHGTALHRQFTIVQGPASHGAALHGIGIASAVHSLTEKETPP